MYITLGVGVGGHHLPEVEGKPWKNFDQSTQKIGGKLGARKVLWKLNIS